MDAIAGSINTLVRFCARRDVPALTGALGADVAILFGGSILAGAAEFAAAVRAGAAAHFLIVGGQGHTTDALRERLGWPEAAALSEAALFDRYLRTEYGVAVDLLEEESTNCGNNVTNALAVLRRAARSARRLRPPAPQRPVRDPPRRPPMGRLRRIP